MDIKAEEKDSRTAEIKEDGSLSGLKKTKEEEFEKALAKIAVPLQIEFSDALFKSLEKLFGRYEIIF